MVFATIWQHGFHLPDLNWQLFRTLHLTFTFGGFARILAVMTGIEVFANLVAAYDGTPRAKKQKGVWQFVDHHGDNGRYHAHRRSHHLSAGRPHQCAGLRLYANDGSTAARAAAVYRHDCGHGRADVGLGASAQGLQNLFVGLRFRHYLPKFMGRRNQFDVADKPVWLEVGLVIFCFIFFGTHEETYLAIYAAGVFILLSMTGWAASKRLLRQMRQTFSGMQTAVLLGTIIASFLTTGATIIIFEERFFEGAWTYLLFMPLMYVVFSYFRRPFGRAYCRGRSVGPAASPGDLRWQPQTSGQALPKFAHRRHILVPLDGSPLAEAVRTHGQPTWQIFSKHRSRSFPSPRPRPNPHKKHIWTGWRPVAKWGTQLFKRRASQGQWPDN